MHADHDKPTALSRRRRHWRMVRSHAPWLALLSLGALTATCTMDFDDFYHGLPVGGAGGTTSGTGGGVGGSLFGGGGTGQTGGSGGTTSGTGGTSSGIGGTGGGGQGGSQGGGGSGGAPPIGSVACGSYLCNLAGGEYSCLPEGGGNPECRTDPNGCPGNQTEVYCDEPGDCPQNELCCATLSSNPNFFAVLECVASCNGPDNRIVCDSNGDCSGNDQCSAHGGLPQGYEICQ